MPFWVALVYALKALQTTKGVYCCCASVYAGIGLSVFFRLRECLLSLSSVSSCVWNDIYIIQNQSISELKVYLMNCFSHQYELNQLMFLKGFS